MFTGNIKLILLSGLWLVFPSYNIYVLGDEILNSLELATLEEESQRFVMTDILEAREELVEPYFLCYNPTHKVITQKIGLNEFFSGFENIGHNEPLALFFYWILPKLENSLWEDPVEEESQRFVMTDILEAREELVEPYFLNEFFSGFENIGHNEPLALFFYWILPK
jgi:hypothetical protein